MPSAKSQAPVLDWQKTFLGGAAELGLAVSESELESYRHFLELIFTCNRPAGLTSITDPVKIAVKHFLDSLTGLLIRDIAPQECVADIGSGAGFPGIVLAIARPQARITLIESMQKRAAFLKRVAVELRLLNVEVMFARVEEIGRDQQCRESFDLTVVRAVATLPVLLEYGLPLLKIGGHLLAYKGPSADKELARSQTALRVLGGRLFATRDISLPKGAGKRALLLFRKIAPTPTRYPRRAGIPAKRPI